MDITRVEINNILSIESATVSVKENGLTLIDGWNFDDDRANGAGKTAICNAIAFGLYDKVPRKITKSEILRWGAKEGFADVTVKRNGRTYRVVRRRPTAAEFYVEGEKRDITQGEFESLVGLNYEQFIIAMYNAQDAKDNFLFLNDGKKKDFFLNLMDLSILNDCLKKAKDDIKDEERQINEEKIELQGHLSKIQAYSESLVDESEIENSIRVAQEKIQGFQEQLGVLNEVPRPDLSKFDQVEEKIREKRKKFQDYRSKLAVLRADYNRLQTQIDAADNAGNDETHDAINCPHCEGQVVVTPSGLEVATDTTAIRQRHRDLAAELRDRQSGIAGNINILESAILKEKELDQLAQSIKSDRSSAYKEYEQAQQQISDIQRVVQNNQIQINSWTNQLNASKENKSKIQNLKDAAKILQDDIQKRYKNIELLEQAAQVFSPTGAPAYIMDSAVDAFNSAVTEYVQLVWPSATYTLQAYKEKKDKSKVAKFSEMLMINGKKCSIGSLSGGQQRALSLAIDFAIRDVMNAHFGINMNPIILDEPFDGLDSVGRSIVIELLEQLSAKRNIWVIDHASEAKAMFNDVIRVEKRSGVTSIAS